MSTRESSKLRHWLAAATCAAALTVSAAGFAQDRFGFGEAASQDLIDQWAIAIPPDGEHLPPGSGTPAEGKEVYAQKCATCHGENLEGVSETGGAALVGGRGTLDSGSPVKTVESYWPYATTVYDFVHRTMPFTEPGSLTPQEVYAVTAYVLAEGGIIGENEEMNSETLPKVKMPNRDGFIPDPRPDVHHYQ